MLALIADIILHNLVVAAFAGAIFLAHSLHELSVGGGFAIVNWAVSTFLFGKFLQHQRASFESIGEALGTPPALRR